MNIDIDDSIYTNIGEDKSRGVMNSLPIGIFDSGIGGLTIMKEIIRQLPSERIIYFGDTARVPYGSKSRYTIINYSRQIVRFLIEQGVKAIVVACNTASALALETIEDEIDIPIIGVIRAGAITAGKSTINSKVGIIGTKATVESCLYNRIIQSVNPNIDVIAKACPLFVPLVEEGWTNDNKITKEVIETYLSELKCANIDTLILGCTHYPIIRKAIGAYMGDSVTLVNPAYETAMELKSLLEAHSIVRGSSLEDTKDSEKYTYYVSDGAELFSEYAKSILRREDCHVDIVKIEKY